MQPGGECGLAGSRRDFLKFSAAFLPATGPARALDRAMMDKYRPLMTKHYLKQKPIFS
jgi:hypothetical protein